MSERGINLGARALALLIACSFASMTMGYACQGETCEGSIDGSKIARKAEQDVEIKVFLKEQNLTLYLDGQPVFCCAVSTGRKPGWTPIGDYRIISKAARHTSSAYGKFVSKSGKVTRRDVDSRRTRVPLGSRFVGAAMPNFLRMTSGGIGIHAGVLPGHPASKGCIRVGRDASEVLFRICSEGDKVSVRQLRNPPFSALGIDRVD